MAASVMACPLPQMLSRLRLAGVLPQHKPQDLHCSLLGSHSRLHCLAPGQAHPLGTTVRPTNCIMLTAALCLQSTAVSCATIPSAHTLRSKAPHPL